MSRKMYIRDITVEVTVSVVVIEDYDYDTNGWNREAKITTPMGQVLRDINDQIEYELDNNPEP